MTLLEPEIVHASRIPASTRRPRIRAVAVIIPAHNEQELLERCLMSVEAAAWRARGKGVRVLTVVVADACTDATRAVARRRGASCVTVHARNVGTARAAGVTRALEDLAGLDYASRQIYLLHTDADTQVQPEWITRHLARAADRDAVLGAVEVGEWSPRHPSCAGLYARATEAESDEHRVHGANLGVRADAYLRVGGFPALAVAEDRALVEALRAAGESVDFDRGLLVDTSARVSNRLHGGFSDYLSRLAESANQSARCATADGSRRAGTLERSSIRPAA